MWGLLPGEVTMQGRLAALGPQQWRTPRGVLRGQTFHHSTVATAWPADAQTEPVSSFGQPERVYRRGALRASYFHAWFASSPAATAALFTAEAA
jgi:cobyrinic acid a,c-diamide synthase